MPLSSEIRRLQRSWQNETAWPKRLEWIEIHGLRGWTGQRVEFQFPIVAISGENGSGKSSILQAAASSYRGRTKATTKFPSEFFPRTAWDTISNATIKYSSREGDKRTEGSIRKPSERWKGHAERPVREVEYFDLSRVVPVFGRVGYAKIAKSNHTEVSAVIFDDNRRERLSSIMGQKYTIAKMAISNIDKTRSIPVLQKKNTGYSGYHQGQGETTITELIQADLPKYALVLIDEIESSLHPRAQRRLVRDLANIARERELQIIITTHSPYVLEELPEIARMQIFSGEDGRKIMTGISAQFAMTKMDDTPHPECEIYVEDEAAKIFLTEIISQRAPDFLYRVQLYPCGASSVGYQLGQMVKGKRFPRPVGVFLDGDCKPGDGCHILPGDDAPEIVVFNDLYASNWHDIWVRVQRPVSEVSGACESAMTLSNHHDWVAHAAKELALSPHVLWHALCGEWASKCLSENDLNGIVAYIEDQLAQDD